MLTIVVVGVVLCSTAQALGEGWRWVIGGAVVLVFAMMLIRARSMENSRSRAVVERLRGLRAVSITQRLVHPTTSGSGLYSSERRGVDGTDEAMRAMDELDAHVTRQVKEIAKQSRNLEALIDGIPEPVLATDARSEVLLCNRAAEEVFSSDAGSIIGRSVRTLFTREDMLRLHDAARAGHTQRAQVQITTQQGPRVFDVAASPVPAAWGEGVFGALLVLKDITELAQSVQAQRDFVANASHELRTPVAAMKIAVETMQDDAELDSAMRARLLSICSAHVQRLEETIRDLLDLSRHEAGPIDVRLSPIDWDDLRTSLAHTFEGVGAKRQLRLAFEIDPAVRGLSSDAKLLHLILRNLIDNATKFAHEGTTIRIRAALEQADGAGVSDGAGSTDEAESRMVRVEVQDQGIGIPLTQHERVFERFYQVDTARTGMTGRRGSGLGLAIVKQVAEALGGGVGVESVWGQGTRVWVVVPMGLNPATSDE